MKTITDDPVGFIENGGWTFLDPESDGEDAHNEDSDDEEDDAYEPTDAETEGEILLINLIDSLIVFSLTEEEDSEMSEYSEASEDVDDDSSEEMGSEEESGKDWSDLEREAAEEDRDRERYGDDKLKHKSSHKSSR